MNKQYLKGKRRDKIKLKEKVLRGKEISNTE